MALLCMGSEKPKWTAVSIRAPVMTRVTPRPKRSKTNPKSGVIRIVPKGAIDEKNPAISGSTPYLITISLVENFRKGETAE